MVKIPIVLMFSNICSEFCQNSSVESFDLPVTLRVICSEFCQNSSVESFDFPVTLRVISSSKKRLIPRRVQHF
jgi:hypothetical protein